MNWCVGDPPPRLHVKSYGLPTVLWKPFTRSRTCCSVYDAFQLNFELNVIGLTLSESCPLRDRPSDRCSVTRE